MAERDSSYSGSASCTHISPGFTNHPRKCGSKIGDKRHPSKILDTPMAKHESVFSFLTNQTGKWSSTADVQRGPSNRTQSISLGCFHQKCGRAPFAQSINHSSGPLLVCHKHSLTETTKTDETKVKTRANIHSVVVTFSIPDVLKAYCGRIRCSD
jgi:hypothetical protein